MTRRHAALLVSLGLGAMPGAALFALQGPPPNAPAAPAVPRPPAATLRAVVSPTKSVDADGFIPRWLILEPLRVPGQLTEGAVQAAVKKEYFPNQFTVVPKDGDTATVSGEQVTWHAVDTTNYNVNLYHFAYALGKPTSNVLFWAVTVAESPREMPGVRLAIGSNAGSVWWVNDQEVIDLYNDRQSVIDDGVSRRLTLRKGLNVVRVAVVNAGGATDFCARFLDAADAPIRDIVVRLK